MNDLEKYPKLMALRQMQQIDIPMGYFSLLPEAILSKIHENQSSIEIESAIPENYFENLYTQIAPRLREDLPLLSAITKGNEDFDTPDFYFEDFFARIHGRLGTEICFSSLDKQEDFDTPAAYFENFYEKIEKKLAIDKELVEMPLLTSIPKEKEAIPIDYFEKMTEVVLQKTQSNSARIIAFGQKKATRWQNLRSAMIGIAACLVLATFYFLARTENQQSAISFQKISDEELIQAIENEDIDDNLLANELNIEAVALKKEKSAIKSISDDEILKYLEEESAFEEL